MTQTQKKIYNKYKPEFFNDFTKLEANIQNKKLLILEVGMGGGVNFQFYPRDCQLIALDYNEKFKNVFIESLRKYPHIECIKYINGVMEDMSQLEDNSIDIVLGTGVLCSVKDVGKALNEVKRVLKPGGKYFFVEHVGYKDPDRLSYKVYRLITDLITPIWTIFADGCKPNRKNWIKLTNAGFKDIKINFIYIREFMFVLKPHIWGYAVK